MNRFRAFSLLAFCLYAFAAQAQGVLSFDADEHDFGTLAEGDKPTYIFAFTNVGDAPVRLANVQPSCGCTTPAYTTEEVQPGGRGEITVEYDSEGRPGEFNKSIAVTAEGAEPSYITLRIRGVVTPKNIQNAERRAALGLFAEKKRWYMLASPMIRRNAGRRTERSAGVSK